MLLDEAQVQGRFDTRFQGSNVIDGYWERPDATADSFADGDGFRSRPRSSSSSSNWAPSVASPLFASPTNGREVPRGYVQVRTGPHIGKDEIRQHLSGRRTKYKIPKSVVTVTDMRPTDGGRIRQRDQRDLLPTPPPDPTARKV